MANGITRHIPNMVTCCNLLSGCIASVMAFQANYEAAILFIILGATFDFFDGMLARLLNVSGPLGKELASLADDITFGFAPSAIVFSLFKEVQYPEFMSGIADYFPYTAFIIAAFSALRLGKFNIDPRQSSSFIGLPTPANALFWGSLVVGGHSFLVSDSFNAAYLFILVILMSYLLVAELPMFSLKFKNLSWRDNKNSYIFFLVLLEEEVACCWLVWWVSPWKGLGVRLPNPKMARTRLPNKAMTTNTMSRIKMSINPKNPNIILFFLSSIYKNRAKGHDVMPFFLSEVTNGCTKG